MPLISFQTAERRIGILGPRASGKSVLMTSLINHLKEHDGRFFRIGDDPKNSAEIRRFRELPTDEGWSRFPYEEYRSRIVDRREWPEKSRDRFEYVCQFERTDWNWQDVRLKLFDLPGERINDIGMLRTGEDTYESWSDAIVGRFRSDTTCEKATAAWFKRLDDPNATEADLLFSYKVALGQLRLAYKPFLTPLTYLLSLEGIPIRGRDVEALARERYIGLSPESQFIPLPFDARQRFPAIATAFAQRFRTYQKQVVLPVVSTLRACDGLIVLIDVLGILGDNTGAHDDNLQIFRDLMRALDPSESFFGRTIRHVTDRILPAWLTPKWIHRMAFVAPKIDLVHPDDRSRVRYLLKSMIDRDVRNYDGLKSDYFCVSAVLSTEVVPAVDGSRRMSGCTMMDDTGRRIQPGEPMKFAVSSVPDEWPRDWNPADFVFPNVYPKIPPRRSAVPEQIDLDRLFNFLCW